MVVGECAAQRMVFRRYHHCLCVPDDGHPTLAREPNSARWWPVKELVQAWLSLTYTL